MAINYFLLRMSYRKPLQMAEDHYILLMVERNTFQVVFPILFIILHVSSVCGRQLAHIINGFHYITLLFSTTPISTFDHNLIRFVRKITVLKNVLNEMSATLSSVSVLLLLVICEFLKFYESKSKLHQVRALFLESPLWSSKQAILISVRVSHAFQEMLAFCD